MVVAHFTLLILIFNIFKFKKENLIFIVLSNFLFNIWPSTVYKPSWNLMSPFETCALPNKPMFFSFLHLPLNIIIKLKIPGGDPLSPPPGQCQYFVTLPTPSSPDHLGTMVWPFFWDPGIYPALSLIWNLNKYILPFVQIHLALWTNTFFHLYKYILQFGQIHLAICTNTSCNLQKYILSFAGWCRRLPSVPLLEQNFLPLWTKLQLQRGRRQSRWGKLCKPLKIKRNKS